MCRLYGFRATEPTKVECSLVHAQNALMEQSRGDREGKVHAHGWGVAENPDGVPLVDKQAWAAWKGEHFKKRAARVYARTVIAHVRQATVGAPSFDNTHPFVHGRWMFAHNGTVPNFERVREPMLAATDLRHRAEIRGTTDSEHVFRYLLTLWEQAPQAPLIESLALGLEQVVAWSREIDPAAPVALNVLWTDGERMVGSRLGRTLWQLRRTGLVTCDICGRIHVHHDPKTEYRSVEVASEPITQEDWQPVPEAVAYSVEPDMTLAFRALEVPPPETDAAADGSAPAAKGSPADA
ncbi:MAG: class II glutamine amidotransferase [Alphaproteobacteria bacterium]|nr:class II glutamine amidotransferase [Alphaproteobacteria bacterium]